MSRLDADALLRRALERSADAAAPTVAVVRSEQTRWASATFVGARHELIVEGDAGPRFDRWLADLPEAELALRGHLVADLKIVAVNRAGARASATVEVLTVEDA